MLPLLLEQLRSTDPAQRRAAIIELVRLGDRAALPALAEIYRNDPDPALRDLALKGGRALRKTEAAASSEPLVTYGGPIEEPAPAPASDDLTITYQESEYDNWLKSQQPPPPVSEAKRKEAMALFNQSLDMNVRGRNKQAREVLRRALALDPGLGEETLVRNLAADLMSMPGDSAIAHLVAGGVPAESITSDEKRKNSDDDDISVSWVGLLGNLSLYGVVNGVMVFLTLVLGIGALNGLLDTYMNQIAAPGTPDAEVLNTFRQFTAAGGVGVAAVIGVADGILTVLALLLFTSFIHIIATTIMGGYGSYSVMLNRSIFPGIIAVFASTAVYVLVGVLVASSGELDSGWTRYNDLSQLSNLVSLLLAVWISRVTADVYHISISQGCITHVLIYALIFLLIACGTFALLSSLSSQFESALFQQMTQNPGMFQVTPGPGRIGP